MSTPRVVLKARRAKPFHNRHPWVFAGAVERIDGRPADGDEVDVVTHDGLFVARGLFNSRSKILTRLYSWDADRPLDNAFLGAAIRGAYELRAGPLGLTGPDAGYRLVNSEGDGLSGLTVDVYGRFAAVQFTSLAMAQRKTVIANLVAETAGLDGVYLRTEKAVGQLEGLEARDGPILGRVPDGAIVIREHGLAFEVNLQEGQKTGFYLDQRDNRAAAAGYVRGRRVLDAFCYSGGFGLSAARAGAASVVCVDGSRPALDLAARNAELNQLTGIEFAKADVFDDLAARAERGEAFGAAVLDPPKFARGRRAIPEALRGYRRLLTLAVRLLEPGGVLVMCCCSGLIAAEMIEEVMAQVAVSLRRELQILERRGAAPDHPVALSCPDSAYLKCFIARAR